jgi:DNA polymerase III alpha subunit
MPDIDLDFPNRQQILDIIKHVPASIITDGAEKKHNSGVYCHDIPMNPLTGNSSIDYKEAESRGYFKIDFLNVSVYANVRDEAHLIKLMNTEPLWELLEQQEFSELLFHLNGHHDVLAAMKPKSIEQLAMVLALIRPAKRHLIGKSWELIEQEIWKIDVTGAYGYKKSHAISYANLVVVHMNLLSEQFSQSMDL